MKCIVAVVTYLWWETRNFNSMSEKYRESTRKAETDDQVTCLLSSDPICLQVCAFNEKVYGSVVICCALYASELKPRGNLNAEMCTSH